MARQIPTGKHRLYSNHDNTNTGDFGGTQFWGFPKDVRVSVIRSDDRQPSEH